MRNPKGREKKIEQYFIHEKRKYKYHLFRY